MSIASDQKRLLESGLLDRIGTTDKGIKYPNTVKKLVEIAEHIITEAQQNLNKNGNVATGELEESIHAEISPERVPTIDILILDRYKFINDGVKGVQGGRGKYQFKTIYPSKKMATAILKWIRKRGIRGRLAAKYKAISKTERKDVKLTASNRTENLRSLSYAISTSIKKKGIKPTKFFTKAFKSAESKYRAELSKGLKLDIIENLKDGN